MLDCLQGKIGIKICGNEEADSNLFVNDLPGNCLEGIQSSADTDQKTWKGVFLESEKNALIQLSTEAYLVMKECFKVKNKECSDELVCANEELFFTAFWYLMGVNLMTQRIYSTRWNVFTISSDDAKELRNDYWNMFKRELNAAIKSIDVDTSGECFQCGGGTIQHVTFLP